jgi:hypothetical protein
MTYTLDNGRYVGFCDGCREERYPVLVQNIDSFYRRFRGWCKECADKKR